MPWVNGYTKKNGTRVKGHWRKSPSDFGLVVVVIVAAVLLAALAQR